VHWIVLPVFEPLNDALPPAEIENGGENEPLGVQLDVSIVIAVVKLFCTVNWAVAGAASAAFVPPIASSPTNDAPARTLDTHLVVLSIVASPNLHAAPCGLLREAPVRQFIGAGLHCFDRRHRKLLEFRRAAFQFRAWRQRAAPATNRVVSIETWSGPLNNLGF
jgi:hypothetical protein